MANEFSYLKRLGDEHARYRAALEHIANMDPAVQRADDLGQAARIARSAIAGVLGGAVHKSEPSTTVNAVSDAERLAFLHTPNEDAEGYEFGIARVKYGAFGSIESCLWTASDHSDIDAIISKQRECKHQFGIFNGNPNSRCQWCGVFESASTGEGS